MDSFERMLQEQWNQLDSDHLDCENEYEDHKLSTQ